MHELARPPLQFYWLRALCRFYNTLGKAHSPLLIDIAAADASLAGSWSTELRTALHDLQVVDHTKLLRPLEGLLVPINELTLLTTWQTRWQNRWSDLAGDPRDPQTAHRPGATYCNWFKFGLGFCFADLPAYLKEPRLPRHVWLSIAHFRLGRAHLWVDEGRRFQIPYADRCCTICAQFGKRAVEDAHHVIFDCLALMSLREQLRFQSLFLDQNVQSFMGSPLSATFISEALDMRKAWLLNTPLLDPTGPGV